MNKIVINKKVVIFICCLAFPLPLFAGMQSENYQLHNLLQSGGGESIFSGNYQIEATIGQSSSLMDPENPPMSDTYDLYPGFWYTVLAPDLACLGDFNGDKDVDGTDLKDYIIDSEGMSLDEFTANFGRINCP